MVPGHRPGVEVRERVDWDDETDGEVPALAIDGQAVSWGRLGRMLSTYEGWRCPVESLGKTDEP